MKILNWIFSVFCILCLPVYGFHIGSILMCVLGIASLPIEAVKEKWKVLPAYKVLRPFLLGTFFLVFLFMLPTGSISSMNDNLAETATEDGIQMEKWQGDKGAQASVADGTKESENETEAETEGNPEDETKAGDETGAESEVNTEKEANTKKIAATGNETVAGNETVPGEKTEVTETKATLSVTDVPAYSGKPYVEINGNVPQFSETDLVTSSCESYSNLDYLGRCGVAYACIGQDLMPTEERGKIGAIKPTGWHTVKYDIVDGKFLYNRCHLIGYQLSGENTNTKNLITGTRYMNVEGMLPFENLVGDYVRETGNHVMYRVTPIFEGDNLLASGVQMEAQSVEDQGEGVLFNVYCYNVQPQVEIDYRTGESSYKGNSKSVEKSPDESPAEPTNTLKDESSDDNGAAGTQTAEKQTSPSDTKRSEDETLVWKSATGSKYHRVNDCGKMNPDKATQMTEEEAKARGLEPCSKCW